MHMYMYIHMYMYMYVYIHMYTWGIRAIVICSRIRGAIKIAEIWGEGGNNIFFRKGKCLPSPPPKKNKLECIEIYVYVIIPICMFEFFQCRVVPKFTHVCVCVGDIRFSI